ncbi:MAG: hypothetical protein M1823_006461 [Watsoniomyces obsoletus]|nr:MAG: hypothetical protein M1823_006461 [Watsoniomyces obsoletus]
MPSNEIDLPHGVRETRDRLLLQVIRAQNLDAFYYRLDPGVQVRALDRLGDLLVMYAGDPDRMQALAAGEASWAEIPALSSAIEDLVAAPQVPAIGAAVPPPQRVLSRDILQRLYDEAAHLPRSHIRIATVRRLEKACDDIASGYARELAEKAGMDDAPFGPPKRAKLDSKAVHHYVKVRARLDAATGLPGGETEWTGPHQVTIRDDKDGLLAYLRARQAESFGLAKPRPKATRARDVAEIVAGIESVDDRLLLMDVLEDGYSAMTRYTVLCEALRQVPGIRLDDLLARGRASQQAPASEVVAPLGADERRILRKLVGRLTDEPGLVPFGLRFDGRRVRMMPPPGSQLVEKEELELLRMLSGQIPA